METEAVIQARGVGKKFGAPDGETVVALDKVSLTVNRGQIAAVTGPSGAGKSVFLQLLAGLEQVDSGTITVEGEELTALGDRALTRFRRSHIGFVPQTSTLLPNLSARDNIFLPLRLGGRPVEETLLAELADRLGIGSRLAHHPAELSVGEQQRVALVRALLGGPEVLLADEPTGPLDSESATLVLDLIAELVGDQGLTVVIATRDPAALERASRVRRLAAGRVVGPDGKPLRPKVRKVAKQSADSSVGADT